MTTSLVLCKCESVHSFITTEIWILLNVRPRLLRESDAGEERHQIYTRRLKAPDGGISRLCYSRTFTSFTLFKADWNGSWSESIHFNHIPHPCAVLHPHLVSGPLIVRLSHTVARPEHYAPPIAVLHPLTCSNPSFCPSPSLYSHPLLCFTVPHPYLIPHPLTVLHPFTVPHPLNLHLAI